jgi:RecJ-like exonuclease
MTTLAIPGSPTVRQATPLLRRGGTRSPDRRRSPRLRERESRATDRLATRPCDGCGGAGVDTLGDTCGRCRGHGYLPAPCVACGELSEAATCSPLCEAEARRRRIA